ncbi:hypothetical protein AB4118_06650 [Bosea sp. 2RAB26]
MSDVNRQAELFADLVFERGLLACALERMPSGPLLSFDAADGPTRGRR